MACKTRRQSLFTHGIRFNYVMLFALCFETILAVFLCYVPGMQTAFQMMPIRFEWWLPALPYAAFILLFDEGRKFFLRRQDPDATGRGFVYRETYY